jgi:hypothetical protein
MRKRDFIATGASLAALALVTAGCTTSSGGSGDPAAQRAAIDAAADSALTRLYGQAQGSQQLIASWVPAPARASCARAERPPAITA